MCIPIGCTAQEISLHLSHTFFFGQKNLLPCIQDLYVVSGCSTQSPTGFLHLEVSTELYQVHKFLCRKYRDAQAPGENEDQLIVKGTE